MTEHEKRTLLDVNPDGILLKRFDYSLAAALKRYDEGMPDALIAQALDLTEHQVQKRYQDIILHLRESLGAL